jgi:hypothetical protein
MKTYGALGAYLHVFLEWSTSHPGRFTPGERAPVTLWIGYWVGPRAGLDDVEGRKSCPYRDSNSAIQPVTIRYTDCAIPTPQCPV